MPSLKKGALPALYLLLNLLLAGHALGAGARDHDIEVRAVKTGKVLVIDAAFTVAAPIEYVWPVMTDWDRMHEFVSSIDKSEIVSRSGNTYRVKQAGKIPLGPFKGSYEAVRDIEIFPYEHMRFQGITGSFERLEGSIRFVPDGAATRIVYRAESIPTVWVPPLVGPSVVEHTTRAQFGEMRAEILRRAGAKERRAPTGGGAP